MFTYKKLLKRKLFSLVSLQNFFRKKSDFKRPLKRFIKYKKYTYRKKYALKLRFSIERLLIHPKFKFYKIFKKALKRRKEQIFVLWFNNLRKKKLFKLWFKKEFNKRNKKNIRKFFKYIRMKKIKLKRILKKENIYKKKIYKKRLSRFLKKKAKTLGKKQRRILKLLLCYIKLSLKIKRALVLKIPKKKFPNKFKFTRSLKIKKPSIKYKKFNNIFKITSHKVHVKKSNLLKYQLLLKIDTLKKQLRSTMLNPKYIQKNNLVLMHFNKLLSPRIKRILLLTKRNNLKHFRRRRQLPTFFTNLFKLQKSKSLKMLHTLKILKVLLRWRSMIKQKTLKLRLFFVAILIQVLHTTLILMSTINKKKRLFKRCFIYLMLCSLKYRAARHMYLFYRKKLLKRNLYLFSLYNKIITLTLRKALFFPMNNFTLKFYGMHNLHVSSHLILNYIISS